MSTQAIVEGYVSLTISGEVVNILIQASIVTVLVKDGQFLLRLATDIPGLLSESIQN